MALGKNVRHLRGLCGISLEKLAEEIGMEGSAGKQLIHVLETRDSKVSKAASAIADYFKVPLKTILHEDMSRISSVEWEAIKRAQDRDEKSLLPFLARASPVQEHWPFEETTPYKRFDALPDEEKAKIAHHIDFIVRDWESKAPKKSGATGSGQK